MTPPSQSLVKAIQKLNDANVTVRIDKAQMRIKVDLSQTKFKKISPLLYFILNKFETDYFILIEDIPFCLIPDAAHHIIYNNHEGIAYEKDKICKGCKYTTLCPGWIMADNPNPRPPAVKDLPREIVFEVTQRCNLNCPICFSAKGSKELPWTKIKQLINDCVRLGIKVVRFTGGEPLLYKDIEKALSYAKSKKLYVMVNTNATIMTPDIKRMLKRYANNILISLQGFNSATEQRLTRGTTDFKQKLHTIIELNSRIPVVRLGTIISQTLIKNFSKYYNLVKTLKIRHWELYRPMSEFNSGEFNISPQDLLRIMKKIKQKKSPGPDIKIANPIPFCLTEDRILSHRILCGAEFDDGHSRLVVDVDGFLKPSYFIHKNLGQTIKKAWNNPFVTKTHHLNFLPRECQNCFSLRWCKGGSRNWAKMASDNYWACDPLMKQVSENR